MKTINSKKDKENTKEIEDDFEDECCDKEDENYRTNTTK